MKCYDPQLSGALPATLTVSLTWCEVFLTSPLPAVRYHTATLLGIAARSSQDDQLVQSWGLQILKLLNDKVLKLPPTRQGCPCYQGSVL